ncbi:FimV/HubP family polar landmark protein [Alginatibacterium sediminis]|nr:FimV/HubP family polar landmark protein [Alginatibacterium sediminis]
MGQSKTVATAIVAWALLNAPAVMAENDGAFYVELVGPDEVVDTRKPRGQQITSSSKTYGPTRSSDTLWAIASLNRPSQSVSVYQMMYSLLQKNPNAFRNRNINHLLNGQILQLPSLDEASELSHRQSVAALQADGQIPGGKKKPAKVAPKPAAPVVDKAEPVVAVTPSKTSVTKVDEVAKVEMKVEAEAEVAKPVEPLPSQLPEQSGISQKNLDELREKLEDRIDELEKLRRQEFDVLKQQMDESSQQLIGIAEVNHRMKIRVQELSDELASMRDALGETQQQQDIIINRLDQGAPIPQTNQSSTMGTGFFDSIANIALVIALPLLLLVLLALWFIRRRKNTDEDDEADLEENMSLEDETDEYSRLFTEDLEPEDDVEDINAAFQTDVDEIVEEDNGLDSTMFEEDEDLDSLEPEDESSFDDLELGESDELGDAESGFDLEIDDSELEALSGIDAFDSEDLVPGDIEAVEPESLGNAELNDFGLDVDKTAGDIEPLEQVDEELSFEAAVEQQKEMEAEMASVSQDDINDLLADIDLDSDVSLTDGDAGLEDPSSGFDDLEDLIGETPAVETLSPVETPDTDIAGDSDDDFSIDFESALDETLGNDDPAIDAELEESIVDLAADQDGDLSSLDDLFDSGDDAETNAIDGDTSIDFATEQDSDLSSLESMFESDGDIADSDDASTEEPQSMDSILEEMQGDTEDDSVAADDIEAMFDSLGENIFEEPSASAEELPSREELSDREFVDIDTLLNDAEQASEVEDPEFSEQGLDLDMDEFPDILADESGLAFSDADAELSSKLDLARAYLEIDDKEGARKIIEEVLASGNTELAEEANTLLQRLA